MEKGRGDRRHALPSSKLRMLRASVPELARPEQPRGRPVPVLRPEPERVRQPGRAPAQPPERARVLRQEPRRAPELPNWAELPVGGPAHRRELRPLPLEE
jgi:hypothetical protein